MSIKKDETVRILITTRKVINSLKQIFIRPIIRYILYGGLTRNYVLFDTHSSDNIFSAYGNRIFIIREKQHEGNFILIFEHYRFNYI